MLLNEELIEYQECDNNFIKVKYNDTFLLIETPFMRIPFGIKELNFNNKKNYNFQISINEDYDIKSKKLLEFIIKIEKHAKDKIKDLSFVKDKTFISRIYVGKNSPLITLDIKDDTIFKDKYNNIVLLKDYVNKNFIASISFVYTGVYYGTKNWGLSFKVDEIIVDIKKEKEENITIFNFK